jgi:hypothetical protein
MTVTSDKSLYLLSVLIAILMAVASAGGLFIDGLYRDNILVTSSFRGNDLVSLAVALPMLVAALIFSKRGSMRARLVWMAMLGYSLYNYAFYLFGAAFNRFFHIYVTLFALSIFSLIFGLSRIDALGVARVFQRKTPVRWISGYMMFFAFFLGGLWIVRSSSFLVHGEVPQDIINTGHPTGIVYALDLSLLVPGLVLGAVLLWRRRPWGYVVGPLIMIKAVTYALALIGMSFFTGKAGVEGAWDLAPLWGFLGIGTIVSVVLLLSNMRSKA